jgi:ribosomal protein S18 acetylase RimI-like enzyme
VGAKVQFTVFRPDESVAVQLATANITCWRQAYAAIVPAVILAKADIEEQTAKWKGILGDSDRVVFAATTMEGDVAGFVVAGRPTENLVEGVDGHIAALYILAQFHRRGLGRLLLAAVAKDWLARGGHSLSVGVLAENTQARHFYETLGARLVRTSTYEWDGHPLPDAIYMFEDIAELAALTP